MRQVLTVYTVALIQFGLVSVHCLSILYFIPYVNSTTDYNHNEKPNLSYYPDRTTIPDSQIDVTTVEIVKSFKNSSGFYKINGTLENQDSVILSDIQVIKYYKIPSSINDNTLICYDQDIVKCEYKSANNNQLPPKSFFLTMPPSPDTNIRSD
jgi:hypothetical protein